jgi:hypothetical protein
MYRVDAVAQRASQQAQLGQPALLTWVDDALVNVIAYQVVDERIRAIYFTMNPAKPAFIQRQRTRRVQLH